MIDNIDPEAPASWHFEDLQTKIKKKKKKKKKAMRKFFTWLRYKRTHQTMLCSRQKILHPSALSLTTKSLLHFIASNLKAKKHKA